MVLLQLEETKIQNAICLGGGGKQQLSTDGYTIFKSDSSLSDRDRCFVPLQSSGVQGFCRSASEHHVKVSLLPLPLSLSQGQTHLIRMW